MAFLAVLAQLVFLVSVSRVHLSVASRILAEPVQQQQPLLQYHHGPLLSGPISLNLIWYGHFSPSQRAIVSDFLTSLSSPAPHNHPSVSTWWKTIHNYHAKTPKTPSLRLNLGTQILDEGCSLGKTLKSTNLLQLAGGGQRETAVNIVLTAPDVAVEGFCTSRCGTHGSSSSSQATGERFAYIWVGNSETQCPGQCAWPFHQPVYGPQSPPLVAPNGDAGVDGMVVTLAGLLAGTATNPFGSGYFQGAATAPLEAASACAGMYGKGAYPGYAGTVLVDESGGGSYNAHGVNGRKYLLPALYDPSTSSCTTLV